MKFVNWLFLILSVVSLASCKKETPTLIEPTCSCYIVEEYRLYEDADIWFQRTNTYYQNSEETDCDKNNEIIQTWSTQEWYGVQSYRKRLICE